MNRFHAGYRYHLLTEVNSTNLYAMEKLYAGLAVDGDVFIADYQSAGKGQRGKNWHAQPGESILMSMVCDSGRLTTSQSFRISAAVAVGVKLFLENVTGTNFAIKWPNDLYQGDRKAGGILIENVVKQGILRYSVIGIGINVNQLAFPQQIGNPVSLQMITGRTYNCRELAKQLCAFAGSQLLQLAAGKWMEIFNTYNNSLYGRGEIKKLKRGSVVIPCRIKSVDQHGHLVAGENDEWLFSHGEVEWLF